MIVRMFGISDRSTLVPLPETALSADWQRDDEHRWIDVEAATADELRELLAPLGLSETVLAACLEARRSDRFISQSRALYLEAATHLGWDAAEKPYVSVLCLPTTIITIHRDRQHTIDDLVRGLDEEAPLYARSSSALLYHLLVEIGRANVDAALAIRAEAEQLDHDARDQPDLLDPREIDLLRRRASRCSAVNDDHTYCAGMLQTVDSEALRVGDQGDFYRDMLRLNALGRQLIEGAAARVASLQSDYEMAVQRRVDARLRFLTILSAVFLPMSLVTGVYGMDFTDLPGVGLPFGYLIVIGIMLASAAVTAAYLYWRGWFE